MRRFLAALCAVLALCWAQEAAATPAIIAGSGTGGSIANASTAASVATLTAPTSVDVPVGSMIYAGVAWKSSSAISSVTDTSSNSYAAQATTYTQTSLGVRPFYSNGAGGTTVDLPGPCTVTGTIATTNLTLTAIGTCGAGSTVNANSLVVNDAVTGTSVTAGTLITGVTTPWNGVTGVYTLSASSTVSTGETITIASTITVTFGVTTAVAHGVIAAAFSGMASSPADATVDTLGSSTGAISVGPVPSSGNLATSSEVIFGLVVATNAGAPTVGSGFTSLGVITAPAQLLGYEIVASNAAVTWAPSLTGTSGNWLASLQAFKGASGVGPAGCKNGLLMMGAGC